MRNHSRLATFVLLSGSLWAADALMPRFAAPRGRDGRQYSAVAADFNGDGIPHLAMVLLPGKVVLLRNVTREGL